jgi:hypothetical protein
LLQEEGKNKEKQNYLIILLDHISRNYILILIMNQIYAVVLYSCCHFLPILEGLI